MSRDRLKDHLADFRDASLDAGAAVAHMAQDVAGIVREAVARAQYRASLMPAGDVGADDEIALADAVDFMAQAAEEIQSSPRNVSHDGRSITQVVADFVAKHQGTRGVDMTGTYGPQSTDLIALYVREFQPGWLYTIGHARDLWGRDALPAGWAVVEDRRPRPGDIAVLDTPQPFGNLGIVTAPNSREHSVKVLTQYWAGNADFLTANMHDALGFYRWVGV